MHEPVAHTPCEKAASILYDNLYRRHAGLQDDLVAVDPVATLLSEIVGEPGTRMTYPDTKPARIEEDEEEKVEGMVTVGNVDVTPRLVSPMVKRRGKAKERRKRLSLGLR